MVIADIFILCVNQKGKTSYKISEASIKTLYNKRKKAWLYMAIDIYLFKKLREYGTNYPRLEEGAGILITIMNSLIYVVKMNLSELFF